jgi:hypothetical protein
MAYYKTNSQGQRYRTALNASPQPPVYQSSIITWLKQNWEYIAVGVLIVIIILFVIMSRKGKTYPTPYGGTIPPPLSSERITQGLGNDYFSRPRATGYLNANQY